MKKGLVTVLAVLLISVAGICQQPDSKKEVTQKKENFGITECCRMKGGKMYHYDHGKEMAITKEMEWKGMKMMPDGTCKMSDGKTVKMKEGQCCDSKGKLHDDCAKLLKK
jgi:hypothetical protein